LINNLDLIRRIKSDRSHHIRQRFLSRGSLVDHCCVFADVEERERYNLMNYQERSEHFGWRCLFAAFVVMPCPSTSLAKIWARVHGYI
jgi:hypothetical protein